ncbi:MAG: LAGLIDADG family homing endonuclease [Candidatus Taylorbacteria bacterium]|nr:LAGLIDADG family homing endonuclease [Candidatus Taylorbacteria bacterium]
MSYYRTPPLNPDRDLQAYIIGLAIGDGNLSNPNKRAARLRITCDTKYPLLIKTIANSLELLFPENKVNIQKSKGNYVNVSVYSNHLENLLGWKVGYGSKFIQNVSTPKWIKEKNEYKIKYLKGLIETDGCIYNDRGYLMMIFTTIIPKLAEEVYEIIYSLGFHPHIYKIKIKRQSNPHNYNRQILYHIRLSKNVQKFLDLVQPNKS